MNEPAVPVSRLVTVSAWTVTASCVIAAWVAFIISDEHLMQILGFSGCAMSAVAATCSIRCCANRIARMIRAGGTLRPVGGLRSLSE